MEMNQTMTITLNGKSHPIEHPMLVSQLLEALGLAGKPVVIELDEIAVFPRNYSTTEIREGAKIEVVTLAAGG